MSRRRRKLSPILIVSLVAHVAAIAALALIPQERLREVVGIALSEVSKEEPKPARPEPPPKQARPEPAARSRAAPASRAVQPSAAATQTDPRAFTDLGLTLDSNSVDGLAVNMGHGPGAIKGTPKPPAPAKPKVLVSKKFAEPNEPLPKPRPLSPVLPTYTEAARRAGIQGRVILELTVDERGEVTNARVVEGLGYGLDEAALATAKNYRFAPAMQAGRPVASKFVLAMRFVPGT